MNEAWFTAECLFKSIHNGDEPPHETLLEYRFFLIRAVDESSAKAKAYTIAKAREHTYQNAFSARVQWLLEDVLNVVEIMSDDLQEGTEVYHKYGTISDAKALESRTHSTYTGS